MVEGYESGGLKAKAERIKNKMENLDKMERRSKILGLLALILYGSGFIFFALSGDMESIRYRLADCTHFIHRIKGEEDGK